MNRLATVTVVVGLTSALAGCGGSSHRASVPKQADLAQQRSDFVMVDHILEQARQSVGQEVGASRQPWLLIAHGLPAAISQPLRKQVSVASFHASHLHAPAFMIFPPGPTALVKPRLTGPAAGIAGLFQSYASLSQRGWKITGANIDAIETSSPTGARLVRDNADLYLTCIYDGHFDLALIGKSLLDGYRKLGSSEAFGGSLTQAQVESLARFYSESLRLQPHATYRLS